ncbi:UDP-N-acetylglucosamine 1-carboxyvinyltransferase [Microbacterium hominis]|uniref:UDP-N-acetylglucosamine 1-carboxyvinyltransferase n=1 Tax=Microbacterium hominis TaxID=162426 RepID=A0A7D4U4B0_9MICO|nr:UDP-N-acetylglucosamine 1-carboxyvinyltransferase [Microbacterium hominis]QKJ19245.1 UDP-N-acetylglucosamine 1-carboxyvinyltransferase [Microbacterium hominis]
MKSLLSVTPDANAGEGEVAGEILAIRGGRPLTGRVEVKGAKNLVTKAMVAALLGETPSTLRDVPDISDVQVVRSLLEVHGVRVEDGDEEGTLHFDPSGAEAAHFEEIDAHAGASRIPILFCGPLLHLLGEALIPDLGGCRIGDRPINFHMDALRAFGAVVDKSYEGIRITAPDGLHGANIELPYPSVGATEQVLLTAVRARGTTELRNAAIEPEIMDLIAVLQKMGAIISYEPNRVILIEGVESLRGYDHRAIFDRNEAASWACAALATDGDIFVGGARQQEMLTFLNVFRKAGGWFDVHEDGIQFRRGGVLKPVVVETDVHPGFMTDWQQPLIVALTQADGTSTVHETVYENRLGFTTALNQMGADIVVHPEGIDSSDRRVPRRALEQAAVISGPTPLHGADVVVPDLRGGYSYVIAALAAEGESVVRNIGIIRRGYEKFLAKLDTLGADFDVIG